MCDCYEVLVEEEYDILQWHGQVESETLSVVYDSRGYIRLGNLEDMSCLDHGEKFKVNFCPICGEKIN